MIALIRQLCDELVANDPAGARALAARFGRIEEAIEPGMPIAVVPSSPLLSTLELSVDEVSERVTAVTLVPAVPPSLALFEEAFGRYLEAERLPGRLVFPAIRAEGGASVSIVARVSASPAERGAAVVSRMTLVLDPVRP